MTIQVRDDAQRVQVCRALLATGGLQRLWTESGPTEEARELVKNDGRTLAAGDRALLLATWTIWSGEATALRYDELVGLPQAEAIAKMTTATLYGPRAIDAWLARSDAKELYSNSEAEVRAIGARLFDEARAAFSETGSEPMNFAAPADACGLGALRMADYLLILGVRPMANDERRHKKALRLALEMLSTASTLESQETRAAGRGGREKEC